MSVEEEGRAAPHVDDAPAVDSLLRRYTVWLLLSLAAGVGPLFFIYMEKVGDELVRHAAAFSPWLPPALVAVSMIVICRFRDRFFPGTEGTGIPQAIAALRVGEGPLRDRVLSARVALGKSLLLTIGLLTGQTIGREGPSVHVSACCLYAGTRLARFPRNLVERGLILAGGAAGLAAAFNTPLAAIVFAFEEIGRSFEKSNVGTIVRTVIVACLLTWIPLSDYLFYGRIVTSLHSAQEWLLVPVIAVIGGLLGGLFGRGVAAAVPVVKRLSRARPYTTAAAIGGGLAVLGVVSGGLTLGGGFQQAHAILIDADQLPPTFPLAKAAATFLSLVSAIPGGLFDPSLAVGAGLGQLAWPLVPQVDRQAFVLLVMAAYFAGVVQSPITAAVILVEMTAATKLFVPLLSTSVLAYGVSQRVCRVSLYESLSLAFSPEKRPGD